MIDFFKGDGGKFSMMRLLCFIATISLIPVFYLQPEQSQWAASVIVVALAGKWLQHRKECKQ